MKVIGLDLGLVRTGVAISDENGLIARPLQLIVEQSRKKLCETVLALAEKENAKAIVVGLPISMGGTNSKATERCIKIVNWFKSNSKLQIFEWDERQTTIQAQKTMIETNVKKKNKKQKVDLIAAMIILQSFLDFLNFKKQ